MLRVAIDGPGGTGKSTIAKAIAVRFGLEYIDTGAMYRAVTLFCLQNSLFKDEKIDTEELRKHMNDISITFQLNPTTGKPDTYLNGICVEDKIRSLDVSSKVSYIAALDFVREAMVDLQRLMGEAKGVIMDGRDIGTVVFPNAELKIFVTASDEIRARRRYDELIAKGEKCNMEEILANIRERDRIDSTRAVSPLRKADDAIVLDNSNMTIPEQKAWLLAQFQRVTAE